MDLPRCRGERRRWPGTLVQEQDHSGSSGNWQVADNQLEREHRSIRGSIREALYYYTRMFILITNRL